MNQFSNTLLNSSSSITEITKRSAHSIRQLPHKLNVERREKGEIWLCVEWMKRIQMRKSGAKSNGSKWNEMEVHVNKNIDRNRRSRVLSTLSAVTSQCSRGLYTISALCGSGWEVNLINTIYTQQTRKARFSPTKVKTKLRYCYNEIIYTIFGGSNRFVVPIFFFSAISLKWRPEGNSECLVVLFQCVITLHLRILSYLKAFCALQLASAIAHTEYVSTIIIFGFSGGVHGWCACCKAFFSRRLQMVSHVYDHKKMILKW